MSTSRAPRLLSVLFLAVTVFSVQATLSTQIAAAATPTVTVSGSTTPGSVITVKSSFKSPGGDANYVVDTELYNSSGGRVAQWFDTTWLNGSTTTKQYSWNTGGLPTGTYHFSQGIFNENWAGNRSWAANAGTVTLSNKATTTTAPAASSNSWKLSASSSGTGAVQVHSSFTAPSNFQASAVVLDTEVFNKFGSKVAQWVDPAAAGAGQKFDRTYNWDTNSLPNGPYSVRQGVFSADWSKLYQWRQDGVTVNVGALTSAAVTSTTSAPATTTTAKPANTTTTVKVTTTTAAPAKASSGNPLAGVSFYANPNSSAANQANAWRSSRPGDAAYMDRIAAGGAATWLGNWNSNVQGDVAGVVSSAASRGQVAAFVAYNIPGRDCGSYSAGGASGTDAYKSWIRSVAAGIGGNRAIVILEPDALAQIDCLSGQNQSDRLALLSDAVNVLSSKSGVSVYLDAGHPGWIDATTMSNRLRSAGIGSAEGFALNVSNFNTTSENITYGESLSSKLGGAHYIVDTSRNGNGSNGDWCNPGGRALGQTPTTNTSGAHADAYLWVKQPGESDGSCNGGPSAGQFWADYALGLAKAAWG